MCQDKIEISVGLLESKFEEVYEAKKFLVSRNGAAFDKDLFEHMCSIGKLISTNALLRNLSMDNDVDVLDYLNPVTRETKHIIYFTPLR